MKDYSVNSINTISSKVSNTISEFNSLENILEKKAENAYAKKTAKKLDSIDKKTQVKSNVFLRVLPAYGWKMLTLMLVTNCIAFNATRLLTTGWYHYSMETSFDKMIPYIKEFVIVYIPLAYIQWIIGFFIIARSGEKTCHKLIGAEIIGKLICLICFLAIPTTMIRADITGTDFLNRWVRFIYETDPADNLFPSIHCLESWIIFRSTFYLKSLPKWAKPLNLIVTLLVFASTLFLRQHVIVDVFAGVIAIEIGLLIMKKE